MIGVFWVTIATVTALIGDLVIKRASEGTGKSIVPLLILGVVIYGLNAFAFYFSYKHVEFSSTAVYFSIGTLLVSVLIGEFIFKETITFGEWIGIGLGAASIIVLSKYSG